MPARVRRIVVDVSDRDRAEAFWAGVLGIGVSSRLGRYSYLGEVGSGIDLVLQVVDEPKVIKNRMHLDVVADDPENLLSAIEALGGSRVREVDEAAYAFTVAADPDGNEFCIERRPSGH